MPPLGTPTNSDPMDTGTKAQTCNRPSVPHGTKGGNTPYSETYSLGIPLGSEEFFVQTKGKELRYMKVELFGSGSARQRSPIVLSVLSISPPHGTDSNTASRWAF